MSRNKFPKGKTKTRSSNIRSAMRREFQNVPVFLFTGNIMLVRASVDPSFGGAYHKTVPVPIISA